VICEKWGLSTVIRPESAVEQKSLLNVHTIYAKLVDAKGVTAERAITDPA
jgi:hypothetical protein